MSDKQLTKHKKPDNPRPSRPERRKIVLTRTSHIRTELGRLYSEARNGEVDIPDASRLANMLSVLARIVESSEIEERVVALETTLKRGVK